ncbi:cysteine--tRNA ligase [Leucobacter tardus]|uniref:Cysteine--tRNA ligase n=1 Tax=Leucobacter tardus TaxID=501483 RepID=A0A939QFY6_9MICO|nr:cysteine--tRNA ligase [Leucobacter tardus]MBO2989438.1 cysteine--tRNA ligase [Leucobacter tardus]
MNQRIYDSKRQELLDLDPVTPGEVGLYVCGPTVQSAPHIGHLRSALVYDQIRRWLGASGYRVTLIRNVTDIDDKILDGARAAADAGAPEEWWALAYRVERDFTAAYDAIGVLPPTYEPRATANIQEMIDLIGQLIDRGHAYVAEDGSGSVYFDTRSWPEYGALTHQSLDQMEDAADSEPVGKRDPRDFALWKAHREHEPVTASWASPWGRGRPGWHIECSAMSTRYLGDEFDIHGGGLDLRFPHHENELAQSNAAGHPFARLWIHNGLVNTGGQKMSKSLGNSLFASDLLAQARPIALRYFLGSAHYRSTLEFSEESLAEAETALSRIEGFVSRVERAAGDDAGFPALNGTASVADLPEAFVSAMHDDFGVPQALGVLHQTVRAGNTALDDGDLDASIAAAAQVAAMLDVFGVDGRADQWSAGASANDDRPAAVLDALIGGLLADRASARAAKDFALSDTIRDRLQHAGVALEDSPTGTRWSVT